MKHIFIADDEPRIRDIIEKYLRNEQYKVTTFATGTRILEEYQRLRPDLLVLDINMPGIDGLEICKSIRKTSDVPIIFVTAKDEEIDRIIGLEIGGDDYLSKPFSPRELVVRIKNIFKRMDKATPVSDKQICGDLKLDSSKRIITALTVELKLTAKEYELLAYMLTNPKLPFTREQLLENVWGFDYLGDLRAIDDLVKRIRKKIKACGAQTTIETVWGYGYKITNT